MIFLVVLQEGYLIPAASMKQGEEIETSCKEAQARIRENWMTLGDETAISQSSLTRDLSLQASSLEAGLLLCVLRQNPMFFCCSIQQEL